MRGYETSEKNTIPPERQHSYPILGGRHYERHVCQWDAARASGEGFRRYDLNLSTKIMVNWVIQCADRYLQPLYELMKEELLRSGYLHGDETRIQVADEPDQKGSTRNWMWIYLTDEYSGSSFSMSGHVPDIIRWSSSGTSSGDISPAMATRHITAFRKGSR